MAGNYGVGQPKRSLFDRAMDAITPPPKDEKPATPPPQQPKPGDVNDPAGSVNAMKNRRKQLEDAAKEK
jgi:hypothetical protein